MSDDNRYVIFDWADGSRTIEESALHQIGARRRYSLNSQGEIMDWEGEWRFLVSAFYFNH